MTVVPNHAAHNASRAEHDQGAGCCRSTPAGAVRPYEVEAQTDLRGVLEDERRSAVAKYSQLAVGRSGLWSLVKYELITGLLGPLPGALGLFLRQKGYRLLLRRCGRGVVIGRNVTLRHPHRIVLADRAIIDDNVVLDGKGDADVTISIAEDVIIGRGSILSCKGGTILIGRRANISVNCTLLSESCLRIGERVLIAGHCYIIAGGNHGLSRLDVAPLDQPRIERGGVGINDNCWLGASVTVLDGVEMGRDAVAAAGAVVNGAVAPYAVVGGVPARVLYNRAEQGTSALRAEDGSLYLSPRGTECRDTPPVRMGEGGSPQ